MNSQLQTDASKPLWELLAELELPLITGHNEMIHEWLDRVLKPLNLYEAICHRVEISLQEASTRARDAYPEKEHQHIHLRIYLPAERRLKGNNWSFFRVEKIQDQTQDGRVPGHIIELYLYLEAH